MNSLYLRISLFHRSITHFCITIYCLFWKKNVWFNYFKNAKFKHCIKYQHRERKYSSFNFFVVLFLQNVILKLSQCPANVRRVGFDFTFSFMQTLLSHTRGVGRRKNRIHKAALDTLELIESFNIPQASMNLAVSVALSTRLVRLCILSFQMSRIFSKCTDTAGTSPGECLP